jgi:hypothetical protein
MYNRLMANPEVQEAIMRRVSRGSTDTGDIVKAAAGRDAAGRVQAMAGQTAKQNQEQNLLMRQRGLIADRLNSGRDYELRAMDQKNRFADQRYGAMLAAPNLYLNYRRGQNELTEAKRRQAVYEEMARIQEAQAAADIAASNLMAQYGG